MALETFAFIDSLVRTNPVDGDPKKEGDDHLRGIKATLLDTFPNVTGAITTTQAELNKLDGATVTTAEINILDGVTATTAEINKLDGVTATTAEINHIDGVTSPIQTQIDNINTLKANLASPALTGVPTAPTATAGTNTTQLATTAFVIGTSFSAAVPVVAGDARKFFTNDGNTADWSTDIDIDINDFVDGTDATKKMSLNLSGISTGTTRTVTIPNSNFTVTGNDLTQTLNNKTINIDDDNLTIRDNGDTTKTMNFQLSGLTTSTNRVITVADNDIDLDTPGWRLLSVQTFASDTTVDLEWTNGTYDNIVIIGRDVVIESASLDRFQLLFKIGGAYVTASNYRYTGRNFNIGSSTSDVNATGQAFSVITTSTLNINNTAEPANMRFDISNPGDSTEHVVKSEIQYHTNAVNAQAVKTYSHYDGTGILTGIRLHTFANLAISGTFKIYGIRSTI